MSLEGTRVTTLLRMALASGQDLVGPATRRTGQFVIVASVLIVLTTAGVVESESLPGYGLRLTGEVATLDVVLVVAILSGLLVFSLRLVADIERLVHRELVTRLSNLQLLAEAETRRLDEAVLLSQPQDAASDRPAAARSARRQRLQARLSTLSAELERLRSLGESGSRFSIYAADRQISESELAAVLQELGTLEPVADIPPQSSYLTPRQQISDDYVKGINQLRAARALLERSPVVVLARQIRVALDIALAPLVGILAVGYWAAAI